MVINSSNNIIRTSRSYEESLQESPEIPTHEAALKVHAFLLNKIAFQILTG